MTYMKTYTYRIIIEPDGKKFHAYVPALPGCHTFGKTFAEARKYIKEAIIGYIECLVKEGDFVPKDEGMETYESIRLDSAMKVYA